MKDILLVHHRLPYPLDNGMDKLRFNLIRTLSKEYNVTLIVPITEDLKPEYVNEVKKIVHKLECITINSANFTESHSPSFKIKRILSLLFFNTPFYCFENYHPSFRKELLKQLQQRKYLVVQFLSDFSAYYSQFLSKGPFLIIGPMDDMIETNQSYRKQLKGFKEKTLNTLLSKAIVKYFRAICVKADLVFFHSKEDAERVKQKIGIDFNYRILQVSTAPVQTIHAKDDLPEHNAIVFTGGLGTHFNQDAVKYLVEDIFPMIKKELSDVKLYIVGNHPPQFILDYASDRNIIVTGAVPSVDEYVRKAAVYVSPIRVGTGIKTKIIEAMSFGKAIVATTASLQGLWNVSDSVALADSPKEFAEAVTAILKDDDLRLDYQNKAGSVFEQFYSLEKNGSAVLDTYKTVLKPVTSE